MGYASKSISSGGQQAPKKVYLGDLDINPNFKEMVNENRIPWYYKNQFIDKYAAAFTEGEAVAVSDYRSEGGYAINQELREFKRIVSKEVGDTNAYTWADRMDSAINKSSAPEDFVAWRGLKSDSWFRENKEGDVIEDLGYVSTSTNMSEAVGFAERRRPGHEGEPWLCQVYIPKGSHGVQWESADALSERYQHFKGNKATRDDYSEYENEWILPRNSEFRILNIKKGVDTGFNGPQNVITLLYLGQNPKGAMDYGKPKK